MSVRHVEVRYTIPVLYSEEFKTLVTLSEGYSDESDIPAIISVSLWSTNANADLIHVQSVEDVPAKNDTHAVTYPAN